MIIKAKNITKEPTTLTLHWSTASQSEVSNRYIAAESEIQINLPEDVTELHCFSEYPDSVIISGVA